MNETWAFKDYFIGIFAGVYMLRQYYNIIVVVRSLYLYKRFYTFPSLFADWVIHCFSEHAYMFINLAIRG